MKLSTHALTVPGRGLSIMPGRGLSINPWGANLENSHVTQVHRERQAGINPKDPQQAELLAKSGQVIMMTLLETMKYHALGKILKIWAKILIVTGFVKFAIPHLNQ